jgi:hypothetical protein
MSRPARGAWIALVALVAACGDDSAKTPDGAVGVVDGAVVDAAALPDTPEPMPDVAPPPVDASIDAPPPPIDAGIDASTVGGVICGTEACFPPESCCLDEGKTGTTLECTLPAACPGAVIVCDGAEDCGPGMTCCLGDTGVACQPEASCMFEICHDVGDCAPGLACCPFVGPINICLPGLCI